MKRLFRSIWKGVAKAYNYLRGRTKEMIPIAIKIVDGIKKVMDSPVDDIILSIIKDAIPGTADDILIDKVTKVVEKWVPKVLIEMQLIQSIAGIENTNDQLQAILDQLKLSSEETKNIIYHGLASLILEKLSDRKLTWTEATAISEYYYKNILKK